MKIMKLLICAVIMLANPTFAESKRVAHFVEDADFQSYIDGVDLILSLLSSSNQSIAAEKVIFFSGEAAIRNNRIDSARLWFMGTEIADYYQKIDTQNENCFIQLHDGPSKVRVIIAVNNATGGINSADRQCYLGTLGAALGVDMSSFPSLSEAEMLSELIKVSSGDI